MATVKSSIARNRAQNRSSQNLPNPRTPTGKNIHAQRALRQREVAGRAEIGQRQIERSLRNIPLYGKQLSHSFNKTKITRRRIRAFMRSGIIAYSLAWFYPVQLMFAFFFVLALGAASLTGVAGWFVGKTAEAFMMVSWIILIALGTGFMLYAAALLTFTGVRVWRYSMVFLMFAVCLGGYWAPFLFFFPWVYLWLAVVIWAQR